jgi:hypothetical protein
MSFTYAKTFKKPFYAAVLGWHFEFFNHKTRKGNGWVDYIDSVYIGWRVCPQYKWAIIPSKFDVKRLVDNPAILAFLNGTTFHHVGITWLGLFVEYRSQRRNSP